MVYLRGAVEITTTTLFNKTWTRRFCAGSSFARGAAKICSGQNLW